MRGLNYIMIFFLSVGTFKCMNVVVKNIKTSTVQVAKIHDLYELGDTIIYQNVKSEVVRKKLKNGSVIKKEKVIVSAPVKQQVIPPPGPKMKKP